ncbi:MAG: DUF2442 domain-containing protein [Candidatus Omnitrophica bacterium]|nr:DUF2442 domain-containing protein [Candidatus Omnitrophota bacterium]
MKILELSPRPGFRLFLRFEDGVTGEVDLSDLAGRGVFSAWLESGVFDQARPTEAGAAEWPGEIDLCPDLLYMRLTGKSPEEVLPALRRISAHA